MELNIIEEGVCYRYRNEYYQITPEYTITMKFNHKMEPLSITKRYTKFSVNISESWEEIDHFDFNQLMEEF